MKKYFVCFSIFVVSSNPKKKHNPEDSYEFLYLGPGTSVTLNINELHSKPIIVRKSGLDYGCRKLDKLFKLEFIICDTIMFGFQTKHEYNF